MTGQWGSFINTHISKRCIDFLFFVCVHVKPKMIRGQLTYPELEGIIESYFDIESRRHCGLEPRKLCVNASMLSTCMSRARRSSSLGKVRSVRSIKIKDTSKFICTLVLPQSTSHWTREWIDAPYRYADHEDVVFDHDMQSLNASTQS